MGSIKLAGVTVFTLAELSYCTDGFNEKNLIGQGGAFGTVYRGQIGSAEVAVKMMQGNLTAVKRKQFAAEVNTLSLVHQTNLIQLIGYCDEGGYLMLVYPYFRRGCLYSRLHPKVPTAEEPPLTLPERMSIALDIAEALRYLHYGAIQPIIHRDVKSSNVLLSDGVQQNVSAVLADFGLATMIDKLFKKPEDAVVSTMHVAGTSGYMAPECYTNMKLTVKTDVYAFGVLLLELLTGKKAVIQTGNTTEPLLYWVRSMRDDPNVPLSSIVDTCLQASALRNILIGQMVEQAIDLGIRCGAHNESGRPTMTEALEEVRTIARQLRRFAA